MRPAILNPLFADVAGLKGVGPAVRGALRRLLGYHSPMHQEEEDRAYPVIRDLLFHLPSGMVDRRKVSNIGELQDHQVGTTIVTVDKHYPNPKFGRGSRAPYRVRCSDDSGSLMLVFFNAREDYVKKTLPEGEQRVISGEVELFDGVKQITHPDLMVPPEQLEEVARLEPRYPLTHGISQKQLIKLIRQAIDKLVDLPEWIDSALKEQKRWPSWATAAKVIHFPSEAEIMTPDSPARLRLAYDEILANQLALALVRHKVTRTSGVICQPPGELREQLLQQLPFSLTVGQQRVLQEIDDDLGSGHRMLRLLQGDVGSGKTVVALLAMLPVIEAGCQCALMVPTDILGRQHLATLGALAGELNITVEILTGKLSAAQRRERMAALEAGEIDIIIGTHALFQQDVSFKQLGMVVIDEQHRFGVNQRLALAGKGTKPHLLLMTATPIPRSLTMTAYGDMESSLLTEKPAGRQEIDTKAISLERIDEVVEGLRRALEKGSKIYWICPLVEESDPEDPKAYSGDLAAAEERYRVFKQIFGDRVALIHGKMKPPEREAAMAGFAGETSDILVATTVVEVGVDVPDATIIVIEHAERFGLAQLHQLRGRVGRGEERSHCILLYHPGLSEIAKQRLKVIRETNDGFKIAEEDLLLRGAGDVLGTRQSGLPEFRFVDLATHRELVLTARDDVKLILHNDPTLESERGKALRILLYLYDYDRSIDYLKAG